jgi:hypothetical protein
MLYAIIVAAIYWFLFVDWRILPVALAVGFGFMMFS